MIRKWTFSADRLKISDAVDGNRMAKVCRTFITPLEISAKGSTITLKGEKYAFRMYCDADTTIKTDPITLWHAYGRGREGTRITLTTTASLPWQEQIELEVLR